MIFERIFESQFSASNAKFLMIFETINENGCQQILQDSWWYLKVNSQQITQDEDDNDENIEEEKISMVVRTAKRG